MGGLVADLRCLSSTFPAVGVNDKDSDSLLKWTHTHYKLCKIMLDEITNGN